MGRQAYMARLAFGRSAFEPPEAESQPTTQGAEESSQSPNPQDDVSSDVQQYDDRGHPINPRSRALARQLRRAKNDVLAAHGVVVRKTPRASEEGAGPARSKFHMKGDSEEEHRAVLFSSSMAMVLRAASTWWISSLRDRLLTYGVPPDLPFAEILRRDYNCMGPYQFFFGGFPSFLLSLVVSTWGPWVQWPIMLIDWFVFTANLSRRAMNAYAKSRPRIERILNFSLKIVSLPLIVHATYQRLGLLPSRPLFPPLRALVPFSPESPLRAVPFPRRIDLKTLYAWASSMLESPVVLLLVWRRASHLFQDNIRQPFLDYIRKPDRPDEYTEERTSERRYGYWRMMKRPPAFWRNFVIRSLSFLGWTTHGSVPQRSTLHSIHTRQNDAAAFSQLEGQAAAAAVPQPPRAPGELTDLNRHEESITEAHGQTASMETEHEDHLPAVQDVLDVSVSGVNPPPTESQIEQRPRPRQRVTELSEEPAMLLSSVLSGHITDWVLAPLSAVLLRRIVASFMQDAGAGQQSNSGHMLGRQIFAPFAPWSRGTSSGIGLRAIGSAVSKVALCYAIELLIGFGVWGCEWALVTGIGKRFFGWGKL